VKVDAVWGDKERRTKIKKQLNKQTKEIKQKTKKQKTKKVVGNQNEKLTQPKNKQKKN